MTKLIEQFDQSLMRQDWRTNYLRYRFGRLKHQYWLWNRKRSHAWIDTYDQAIITNCQPGNTVFFGSAGYYLRDIYPEIYVVEQHEVVSTFYPEAYVCERNQLATLPFRADNFAVVNNRADHWVDLEQLTEYIKQYTQVFNPSCRFFYSFRDTQMHVNRLTTDLVRHFTSWAHSLYDIGLTLVWSDLQFPAKAPGDQNENPDTTNGNIKFWFVYSGTPWKVINV